MRGSVSRDEIEPRGIGTFSLFSFNYCFDFAKFSVLMETEFGYTPVETRQLYRDFVPFRIVGGMDEAQAERMRVGCKACDMVFVIHEEKAI